MKELLIDEKNKNFWVRFFIYSFLLGLIYVVALFFLDIEWLAINDSYLMMTASLIIIIGTSYQGIYWYRNNFKDIGTLSIIFVVLEILTFFSNIINIVLKKILPVWCYVLPFFIIQRPHSSESLYREVEEALVIGSLRVSQCIVLILLIFFIVSKEKKQFVKRLLILPIIFFVFLTFNTFRNLVWNYVIVDGRFTILHSEYTFYKEIHDNQIKKNFPFYKESEDQAKGQNTLEGRSKEFAIKMRCPSCGSNILRCNCNFCKPVKNKLKDMNLENKSDGDILRELFLVDNSSQMQANTSQISASKIFSETEILVSLKTNWQTIQSFIPFRPIYHNQIENAKKKWRIPIGVQFIGKNNILVSFEDDNNSNITIFHFNSNKFSLIETFKHQSRFSFLDWKNIVNKYGDSSYLVSTYTMGLVRNRQIVSFQDLTKVPENIFVIGY